MTNSNLICIDDLTTRKINIKKSLYEFATISKDEKDEYEFNGWEEIPSRLKKSIKARKPKKHSDAFEDRVWALCAKLGFDYINENNEFKIEYENGLKKQIDVFTYNSETILIIECKSTQTRKSVSYQKDINELIGLKNKLRLAAHKLVGKKLKVAFLFCTNNAIVSQNDRLRLENSSIFHFNQDIIEYYEQLTEYLGKAAKYQLFGHLFAGQKIPELKNKIPAIKGKVSAGHTIYSFCIDPEYLLKIGFILHRTDPNPDTTQAYQRLVKKPRLNQIAKYIENNGYFPNSIIINIETKKNRDLKFEESSKIPHDGNTNIGILHLPKTYRSAFIIDGQHRLYGYSKTISKSNHTLPVVAFHNLPIEEQSKIFVDINQTQRSVPANLLQSIMVDFHWDSPNDRLAMSALKTRLFIDMDSDDDSPFYKRVQLAEEKKTEKRCLTIKSLRDWGLNRVKYFGELKGDKIIKTGFLQDTTHLKTLIKSKDFFNICFKMIENKLSEQWNKGSADGGFIGMNIGVTAIIRVLDDIIDFAVINDKIDPYKLNGVELASSISKYLIPVILFVNDLDYESSKKLRGLLGSGGTIKVHRHFQESINKEYPSFNPDGLEQWIKDNSGKFDDQGRKLGHKNIEPLIDRFVKLKLKEDYGVKNKKWWIEGVPKKIQLDCASKKIADGSSEPNENFLNTIHYHSIISHNWELLGNYFTPPGLGNVSKEKKLSWLNKFNDIRKKYTHPQREPITEKELEFLKKLYEWLSNNLN